MEKTEWVRRDKKEERDREKINGKGINILGCNIWKPKEAETTY